MVCMLGSMSSARAEEGSQPRGETAISHNRYPKRLEDKTVKFLRFRREGQHGGRDHVRSKHRVPGASHSAGVCCWGGVLGVVLGRRVFCCLREVTSSF